MVSKNTSQPKIDVESEGEHSNDLENKTKVLYELMNISKTATPDEIKKAYRKLALLQHPDKCPDNPAAADNFQKLNLAYNILKDPKKRARYDQYGDDGTGDGNVFATDDWLQAYDYYRNLHPEIEKQDIKCFAERYKCSIEEEEDLIEFYEEKEGDLTLILECIMLSRNEDVQRFVEFYETQIQLEEIERYDAFDLTKENVKMLPDEKVEAKKLKNKLKAKKEKEKSAGSMADLEKMILAKREGNFNSFLSNLEAKYCNDDNVDDDEIDDIEDKPQKDKGRKRKIDVSDMPTNKKRVKK